MCRYGFNSYKPHLACFDCRKAFKRRRAEDIDGPAGKPAICPQCGQPMADMGLDFKPPRQSNRRAWKVLRDLWVIGETFHSCGCGGPGYRPRGPREFEQFLRGRRRQYGDYLARLERSDQAAQRDSRGKDYWRARLTDLESFMASHGYR